MNDWYLDVHALVDDELAPEERTKVQENIKKSPQAQAEWYAVREVKTILISKCNHPECEEVWKGCVKRLQEIDKTKRVEGFVGRYSWAICGVFLCMIVGAAAVNRSSGADLRTGDVASASMVPISAPRSQTPDDVQRWLQNNLSKTMALQPGRISITGGRSGHLADGRRVAEADLQDNDGQMQLFVIEHANKMSDVNDIDGHSAYSGGTINDVNCITWAAQGNEYLLAANRPIDQLCRVADALAAH